MQRSTGYGGLESLRVVVKKDRRPRRLWGKGRKVVHHHCFGWQQLTRGGETSKSGFFSMDARGYWGMGFGVLAVAILGGLRSEPPTLMLAGP